MSAGRTLAAVVLFLAGSLAFAEQPPRPPDAKEGPPAATKAAPAPAAPASRAAGGFVVFVDPVTGKIRQPDAAEIGALTAPPPGAAAPAAVEPPLEMRYGPGGAVGVVLDSRFESFVVVTKQPDGTLATSCVTGGRKADETVAAGAKPGSKAAPKAGGKEAPRVP